MVETWLRTIFGLLIIIFAVLLILSGLYADWMWFDSLGYVSVFKTVLFSKIGLGAAVFLLFFVSLLLNFIVLKKRSDSIHQKIYLSVIAGVSLLAGIISSTYWFVVLKFLNYVGFGFVDPIFKNDIGFYMFVLPFYGFVLSTLFFLLLAMVIITTFAYLLRIKTRKIPKTDAKGEMSIGLEQGFQQIKVEIPQKGRTHLGLLAGLILIILSAFFYLQRYSILFSPRGAVFGAGY